MDISHTIIPKSDQLNADDLIGKTMTITITEVKLKNDPAQPISLHYENDNKKPYKPCKGMRRVIVQLWGSDSSKYAGRKLTLYRDADVFFGKEKVGGIRISHASHIEKETDLAITVSRGLRKKTTIKPIGSYEKPKQKEVDFTPYLAKINEAKNIDELVEVWKSLGASIQSIPQVLKAKDDKKAELMKESEVNNG
jgi:hypothetical protein